MSSISNDILSILRSTFNRLKVPTVHDKVYNDECVLTFDSPFSDNGLYVNIITWQGFGEEVLQYDISKGGRVYLHQKWTQVLKQEEESDNNNGPSKLAIGIPGGFITESKYDIIKEHSVVVIDQNNNLIRLPFPNPDLPEFLSTVINGIIEHNGMKSKMQENQWDADQDKVVSKYAENLVQLDNGKKISNDPNTWKCELRGDSENLWLNLSTGYIGGGRKNWDGTGGSGGALQHYIDTGKQYPLCVKLGTITPNGADVWSYSGDEDNLVIDPHLGKHLAHWGIDIMKLDKTDKSLGEMEVDLNMKYDWSRIIEDGENLQLRSGPGSVGLRNIGSSCYMNSVLQVMATMPEVKNRYFDKAAEIMASAPTDPTSDFACQFSKVVRALNSSRYVPPLKDPSAMVSIENGENSIDESTFEKYVVAPRMFKHLVGKGHAEFSGGRQQDASEYLSFLLEVISKAEKTSLRRIDSTSSADTSSIFDFNVEYKYVCPVTGQVKYNLEKNSLVNLFIPLDKAVNKDQVEQESKKARIEETASSNHEVKPIVPLELCLESFLGEEQVQMYNSGIQSNVLAKKSTTFKTFPRYLAIILKRYFVNDKWMQVKIDAHIPMPEHLDLSSFKSIGPLPDEKQWVEDSGVTNADRQNPQSAPLQPDETLVLQLISMGFSENGCKRAAIATNNADVETSMNWIFEHMEDPDFNDPISTTSAAPIPASTNNPSSEMIEIISSMGYTAEQGKAALKATDNNLESALDWIFSHMDNLDAAVMEVNSSASNTAAPVDTTSSTVGLESDGKYSLLGFISHIGKNTESGHYVSHIKKDGEWRLYNDEKVALSTKPPFELGFIYFYRLDDAPETL